MSDGGQGSNSIGEHAISPTGRWAKPLNLAALMGGLYLVFCSAYIWISGRMAVQHAGTVEDLARLETIKGLVFVLVCALLVFFFSWWLLKRLAQGQQQLAKNRQALLMTERRAMTGSLASSIAPDMHNILTVGRASAEMLLHTAGLDADQKELAGDINSSFQRIVEMTRRLSTMGRTGTRGELTPGDLKQVLEEELSFARRHARLDGCAITLVASESIPAYLNLPMLQNLLLNLLINAAEATKGKGRIEVRLQRERNSAVLEIHDSGPGIPEDQRERVFDAFYTTKDEGRGLGLLSVKAAAQMHRGRILVQESPLGGACFRLTLPLNSPTA